MKPAHPPSDLESDAWHALPLVHAKGIAQMAPKVWVRFSTHPRPDPSSARGEAPGSERLIVFFRVENPNGHTVNAEFKPGTCHWGLWEWDVVEIFVRRQDTPGEGYWEFQCSPRSQGFELKIEQPRKIWDEKARSGYRFTATVIDEKIWEATLEIPLSIFAPANGTLMGGAFAILGPPQSRYYFGLFLPTQNPPDFHLPHCFRKLPIAPVAQ